MKILFFVCIIAILLFFLTLEQILAKEKNENENSNQFVTIVNPIRTPLYNRDLKENLEAQYAEVAKRQLSATWLLTYDVILDPKAISVLDVMDKSQEFGIFLEITPKLTGDANVVYNKTDSWHRANSVFLSGYTQDERRKLIDKVFEKYNEIFHFYPNSVGAWWIDSYSLEYMKQKYNINGNLTVSDQFSTDGYKVWGQYWSTPFYPSLYHAGMPARTLDNKLDIVTLQWAPRDPLNGYGRVNESLYSTQDYFTINLSDDYFEKLLEIYGERHKNKFGHITVGLEGDLSPQAYQTTFARQLDIIKSKHENGIIEILTMKDFSNWYRSNFPNLSPVYIIQTDDLLGKRIKTIWYQSPNYRINIIYNYDTNETKVRDFRAYHDNFQEPYYISPNRDLNLSINLPSQIDSATNPGEEWTILTDELLKIDSKDEEIILSYKNNHQIKLRSQDLEIVGDFKSVPDLILNSPLVNIRKSEEKISIEPKTGWNFSQEGLVFRALTQDGTYFLRQRKIILAEILGILFFVGIIFFISKKRIPEFYKMGIISILIILTGGISFKWYLSNSRLYFVNQSELDVLNRLSLMPGKKIIVYDKVCLQCEWHTTHMPAIFANKRNYVQKITKKQIAYNFSVIDAKSRAEAKKELDRLNADYIYLVKFENYKELAPFSPGDLGIEEIYSNANANIWRVKKN